MKLTPLDIRHKEFKRGMRGYADTEVDEFLDEVADEFERLFKENIDIGERLEALEEKVTHYRMIEDTLQKTLLSAQQSAEELKQNATKEGQLILRDAELKARQMVNESYADKQRIEKELTVLKNAEDEFRFRFRNTLEGYLKQMSDLDQGAHQRMGEFQRQADALKKAIAHEDSGAAPAAKPGEGAAARFGEPHTVKPPASAPPPPPTLREALESQLTSGARETPAPAPSEEAEESPVEASRPVLAPEQGSAKAADEDETERTVGGGPAPAAPAEKPEVPPDLAPPANTGVSGRRVPVEWQVSPDEPATGAEAKDEKSSASGKQESLVDEDDLAADSATEAEEDDFKW